MGVRKPRWYRNQGYLAWIRSFVCSIGGRPGHICGGGIEAAHARVGTDGGAGVKPSDWWTLPLCHDAHAEQHQIGEPAFEKKYAISMREIAKSFWTRSDNNTRRQDYVRELANDNDLPAPHQAA